MEFVGYMYFVVVVVIVGYYCGDGVMDGVVVICELFLWYWMFGVE